MTDRSTRIQETAAAALAGSGVVIEDVAVHPAGKRRLVRIGIARDVADLPDSDTRSVVEPLTLDEVAAASRAVGEGLDEADAMGSAPYTLEVTSLGVDHPLTTPAQFRRNVGRLLQVTLVEGSDPATVEGRLYAAGPDGIQLGDDQLADGELLPYDRISVGRVQVEFTRPATGEDN